jgi:hypothetical protein
MTIPDTMARLGYTAAQAAEAAGCSHDTIERALAGKTVSRAIELSLERHARLVLISDMAFEGKGIPIEMLEERVQARLPGRPRAA